MVDGPNILRKAFHINLKNVKDELSKYGEIRSARVYIDQFASDKLIEAITNQGFETVITTGDVDVTMAIEGMEVVLNDDFDILALMTRDTDYLPLLFKAKKQGKQTIILATDVALSTALKNTADRIIILSKKKLIESPRSNYSSQKRTLQKRRPSESSHSRYSNSSSNKFSGFSKNNSKNYKK